MMEEVTGRGGREWGVENYSIESIGGVGIYRVNMVGNIMKERKKYSMEGMAWRRSRKLAVKCDSWGDQYVGICRTGDACWRLWWHN
jgi:hypothetical protein